MKNTTAVVLILISIGLFYTFINPQYGKVKELRAEAAEYQSILENVEALKVKRDALLAARASIPKDDLDRISKVLPTNVDTVRLALDFDTIAAKYGISIKSIGTNTEKRENNSTIIAPARSGSPSNYQEVIVSFSFAATYENFRKFMKDIESSLRVIDIQSVSFTTTDTALNEYSIEIKTYWLK